jgi:hypothetical protein
MKGPSSNARAGFLIVLLAAIFTFALLRAFSFHFATGDIYPDYSSMKATPLGAKLLYDGLSRTPGIAVSRNYFPLEYLDASNATIVLLRLNAAVFGSAPQTFLDPIERLANRGNRVVAALYWEAEKGPEKLPELDKRWHVKLQFDAKQKWLYITEAPGWRVLESAGPKLLAVEKDFQKGSVVLFAESRDFSNQSVVKFGHLDTISAALGHNRSVIFDEQHFGMAENGTVAGLARRFRLTGMAIGLALCAALFIWKNAASFPPPADAPRRAMLAGRTSMSGLYTLLRRYIKPGDLAATCWNEWVVGNGRNLSPERRARAEAIVKEHGSQPLEAVREIQTALHAKGPL